MQQAWQSANTGHSKFKPASREARLRIYAQMSSSLPISSAEFGSGAEVPRLATQKRLAQACFIDVLPTVKLLCASQVLLSRHSMLSMRGHPDAALGLRTYFYSQFMLMMPDDSHPKLFWILVIFIGCTSRHQYCAHFDKHESRLMARAGQCFQTRNTANANEAKSAHHDLQLKLP
eukprot:6183738-Pleurochrysis_carterae.AAC.1